MEGLELQQYEVAGNDEAWDSALGGGRASAPAMISVKTDKKRPAAAAAAKQKPQSAKKQRK